jgi:hypothetical protein
MTHDSGGVRDPRNLTGESYPSDRFPFAVLKFQSRESPLLKGGSSYSAGEKGTHNCREAA